MPKTINFYRVRDEYGCFSNFSPYRIIINGKVWSTTEHYFQAQKFAGTEHEEAVRQCKSAREAADMGRDRSLPLREDWEDVKNIIMYQAVRMKFWSHLDLRNELLKTGDAILVEHTTNDRYWGDGGDGSGKNMLGKILMLVREELR